MAGPDQRSGGRAIHDAFLELVQRHRLTPIQRRIAQYVLEHPEEVLFLDSNQLADRTGASQPSVSRFAQALGFDGYSDLIARLRKLGSSLGHDHGRGAPRNRFQEAVADELDNLRILDETLVDNASVHRLGRDLASSEPFVVLGLRASANIASYFGFFAAKVHPDVRTIVAGGSAAHDGLLQARDAGAKWLLAFALPRVPRETVSALEHATGLGYRIAVVTPVRFGRLRDLADVALHVPVGTGLQFDSQAAPMVVAAVLIDAISDADPSRTQRRLEAFERLAAERGYFEPQ